MISPDFIEDDDHFLQPPSAIGLTMRLCGGGCFCRQPVPIVDVRSLVLLHREKPAESTTKRSLLAPNTKVGTAALRPFRLHRRVWAWDLTATSGFLNILDTVGRLKTPPLRNGPKYPA